MIPPPRCHRIIRPQTTPIAPLRADFRQSPPVKKVKKIARRFERSPRVLRLINVGAVIPPHRLYSARAPIHPKRPYSLTRPVVPPDGSFVWADISGFSVKRNRPYGRAHAFAAIATQPSPVAGLTADTEDSPPFSRLSLDDWASVRGTHWTK
jgi:hypothetical protein